MRKPGFSFAAIILVCMLLVSGCTGVSKKADPQASPPPTDQKEPPAVTPTPEVNAKGTHYLVVKGQSTAQYEVGEKFADVELPTNAIGVTSEVDGELILSESGQLLRSLVKVDVRTLKSDKERRDMMVGSALRVSQYQFAEYTLTGMAPDSSTVTAGNETTFKLKGNMKLVGTERPLEFDAKAKLDGDLLEVTATTTLKMSDFKIKPPSIMGFVNVNDEVKLTVKVVGKKQ